MIELILGSGVFMGVIMVLVLLILAARARLVPQGEAEITINEDRKARALIGSHLLSALAEVGILMPSACGGRGTCGQCRITVLDGGGTASAVEASLLTSHQLARGERLGCQVSVRDDMKIEVPADVLGVRKWSCRVRSTRNVATLIKEIVLELPEGDSMGFRAGAYVQVTCPPHRTEFADLPVNPEYDGEWDRLGLRRLAVTSAHTTSRAYSIASPPSDGGSVMLLVRIATPPPDAPDDAPPGVVSSWLFGLRTADAIEISGPYGGLQIAEGDREMVLVGGGVGMAPLRSIILDQLLRVRTSRPMSFWYGARNVRELFYREEFDRLSEEFPHFRWCVALSGPRPEDGWEGDSGFIHEVLLERYLKDHASPEECDYFLCGPPLMIRAVLSTLYDFGVDRENIWFDDFGGGT